MNTSEAPRPVMPRTTFVGASAGTGVSGPRQRFAPATLVGARAAAALVEGARGSILAAFSGAAYIQIGEGPLLWISGPGGVPHGRALLAAVAIEWTLTGEPVRVENGVLNVGQRLRIGLRGAPVWRAPAWSEALPGAGPGTLAVLGEVARGLVANEVGWAGNSGEDESAVIGSGRPDARILRRLAERSALPWRLICQALQNPSGADFGNHLDQIANAALGLGPGLTPSGDDFMGGLLFALELASRAGITPPGMGLHDAGARLFPLSEGRTTPISQAFLADYARGEGPEPLHRLAAAVLVGDPGEGLVAARRLVTIGQTTGWATFTGLVVGLTMTLGLAMATDRTEAREGAPGWS